MTAVLWEPTSPWPEPHELLLLRAALLDGREAVDAWERFGATHSGIEHLDYGAYRLLPQLYRNLRALGVEDPALARLKGVYRHAWYANQQLLHDAAQGLRLLREDGIEAMVIKGAALLALYEHDVGVRPMDDVDFLVRPDVAERALEVLGRLGWRNTIERPVAELMRVRHSADLVREDDSRVDLHWTALYPRSCDRELWDDAVPVVLRGVDTLAPSPTDQLLLACGQGLGWYPAPLRWITDALLITRSAGDRIDWPGLVRRARDRDITLAVADALEFLEAEFSLALPDGLLGDLRRPRPSATDRLLHAIKTDRVLRGPAWQAARLAARRWDCARRLATAPSLPAGHPAGLLDYVREEWGAPSRRAALVYAARKSAAVLRGTA